MDQECIVYIIFYRIMIYTLVAASTVILLTYFVFRKRRKWPPGPKGLPFFGQAFDLNAENTLAKLLEWKQIYGDIYKLKLFGINIIVVSGQETIWDALVTYSVETENRPDMFRAR